MDPNTLSMEQGKELLKLCGIPQRDIDLMTEKWVVVASVEVLLRFPLMPGEDPGARCVSNKKHQIVVNQLHTFSQRPGDQEERLDMSGEVKINNHLMSKADQKPKDVKQTSGHLMPQKPTEEKNPKKKQSRTVRPRASPQEEEYTMVKCKNCGAFGHNTRSKRCPMKCWDQTLSFQPLSSNKFKENLKPRKSHQFQNSGPCNKADRVKDQRPRQEEHQQKALPQKFPKKSPKNVQRTWADLTKHCAFLRQPIRPLPVQTTKKGPALGPALTGPVPAKKPDTKSFCPTWSSNKRPEPSTCGPARGHDVDVLDSPYSVLKNICRDPSLSSKRTVNKSGGFSHEVPHPVMKTPAADHVFNTWAHMKHPYVDSKPSPQPVSQKCGSEFKGRIQAPGKRSIQVPNQPCQNQPKKARLSSFSTLQVKTQLPDLGTVYISQPLPSTSGLSPKQAPKVTTKTPTLNPSIHNKPLPCSPYLLQAQAVVQPLLSSHVPGKPDKIGSMGSDKGWQNSKIRMTPTSNPPEKCTSAGQSPHILKESEGLAPHVPRSVLYEDLMVSSSSEDSDWE